MNTKIINIISCFIFGFTLLAISVVCILKPHSAFSHSERRELAKMPELTYDSVASGEFMSDFENYCADQFPGRETFRSIKSYFVTDVLNQYENNGLYMADNHISKLEKYENSAMIDYATEKFRYIYDSYIKDTDSKVYFSVIPDKNFVLAKKNGYPSIDYESFIEKCKTGTDYMQYIEICDLLSIDDYYRTDSHWRQENIKDIAQRLAEVMGTDVSADYTENIPANEFYGVYAGQYGKKVHPDTIKYLTNEMLNNCVVTYYDNMGLPYEGDMYDMKKAYGKDPYEMFLSGTASLVEIQNPSAQSNKELVLMRDSYGSSLAPLLAAGYRKITLVDIRYIKSYVLGNFVNFDNCDVLFMYSTSILNNSRSLN